MDSLAFTLAPFAGWLAGGSLKFLINTVRAGRPAWDQVGYGGLPSTHSSVVGTTLVLVGLRAGWTSAEFSVASTLAFIVILDATSLRRQIGRQAAALNRLRETDSGQPPLRERLGHRPVEVLAGLLTGGATALLLDMFL